MADRASALKRSEIRLADGRRLIFYPFPEAEAPPGPATAPEAPAPPSPPPVSEER